MKKKDAIEFFGSASALAEKVGISPPAVSMWREIVPLGTATRIEKITNGALSVDLSCYPLPRSRLAAKEAA